MLQHSLTSDDVPSNPQLDDLLIDAACWEQLKGDCVGCLVEDAEVQGCLLA